MRRHRLLGIAAIAILAGCAAQGAKSVDVDSATYAGNTVALTTGDTLRVRLVSNPGTGYRWAQAAPTPTVLTFIDSTFTGPAGTAVGAPGVQQFRFLAAQPGSSTLVLLYARPWETDPTSTDTVRINLSVTR